MQIDKSKYPLIALCIAIFLNGILIFSEAAGDESPIPLLMLLLLSELGFIVSAAGTVYGVKIISSGFDLKQSLITFACASLGVMLGYKGYLMWQSLQIT